MLAAFQELPWLFIGFICLLGLCVGSFSNVVIHRLPARWDRELTGSVVEWADLAASQPELGMPRVPAVEREKLKPRVAEMAVLLRQIMAFLPAETLTKPRSRCPSCGHSITALENIPLVSYAFLRGKCSACKSPISLRYPAIEAFCGLVAAAIAWKFGVTWQCLGALLLFFWLLPLAMIDADTTYLPNSATLPLLWAGLGFNLFGIFAPLSEAVTGAAVGYLFLAIPAWTFEWLKKMEGNAMGRGDFVLMAVVGAWFGWSAILPVVLLSCGVCLAIALPMLATGRRDLLTKIPFGPYIAGAGVAYLFFGAALKSYLGVFV